MPRHVRIPEPRSVRRARRYLLDRVMRRLSALGGAGDVLPANLAGADIRRVLICRPNHRLGNLLLLTPLIVELERSLPNARVDIVLAGEHVAELFENFPNVGHVYNLSRRMARHPLATLRTVMQIRRARYDIAIDPCETSQSGRLLLAVAAARHALADPRTPSPAGAVADLPVTGVPTHLAQLPVFLLRRGLSGATPESGTDYPVMKLRFTAGERQHARAELARIVGGNRRSPPARIIGVFAEATADKRYDVDWWRRCVGVIESSHPDAAVVEIVPADGVARLGVPAFASPSPRAVAAVIANMACFVSADCGVMHLAAAAGVPTMGLFKASDPLKYAPYGHGSCGLVTNGKTPDDVARQVSDLIHALPVTPEAWPPAHATGNAAMTPGVDEARSLAHGH